MTPMVPVPDQRLTVRVSSAEMADGPIRFADFLKTLNATRRLLARTDDVVNKDAAPLQWRLVALSYASPATVSLEPFPSVGAELRGKRVVESFFRHAGRLSTGGTPEQLDRDVLEAFGDLVKPIARGRISVEFVNGAHGVAITEHVGKNVEQALAPKFTAAGSTEGLLEYYNIHGTTNVFRIYPNAGPPYVECRFRAEYMEEAKQAIGRKVRVHGTVHYRELEDFPYRVDVSEIEVLAHDSELPTLMELYGIAPNITGPLTSEDFVGRLRRATQAE